MMHRTHSTAPDANAVIPIQELRSLHQNACSGLHHVLVHQQQRRIELLPSLAEGLR